MDLYAYSQIADLSEIAKKNGIECPRLRGYRLMKAEEPITSEFWKEEKYIVHIVEDLYGWRTDEKRNFYVLDNGGIKQVRWDRIHGKKRKILKTAIHNNNTRYKRQFDMWNKYAGQDGVLYIHARIGGNNWPYYYKDVVNQTWFIEKVDDAFDSTYCDIYASIKVE